MSTNDFGAGYEELRRIFENSLHGILDWINRDAKAVAKASDWKQADEHFGQSFLALWYMFENKTWLAKKNEPVERLKNPDNIFGEKPPFLRVLGDKLGEENLPARPKISGFLTELYMYHFLRDFVKDLRADGSIKVRFGTKETQVKLILGFEPDIVILSSGQPRVLVEVKVRGDDLFRSWHGRYWDERKSGLRTFGSHICPWVEYKEEWQKMGLDFLLFCGQPGPIYDVFDDDKDYGKWIYFPGDNRLEPTTKKIRQALST